MIAMTDFAMIYCYSQFFANSKLFRQFFVYGAQTAMMLGYCTRKEKRSSVV